MRINEIKQMSFSLTLLTQMFKLSGFGTKKKQKMNWQGAFKV